MTESKREDIKFRLIDAYRKYHYKDSKYIRDHADYISSYIENPFYLQLQDDFKDDPTINFRISSEWFRDLFRSNKGRNSRFVNKVELYIEIANQRVNSIDKNDIAFEETILDGTNKNIYKENPSDTFNLDNNLDSKSVHINLNSAEIHAKKLKIVASELKSLPKKLTSTPSVNPSNIYGRYNDLEKLKTLLFHDQQSILIQEIKGSGKTTLISSYVFSYFNNYEHFLYLDISGTNLLDSLKTNWELRRSLNIKKELIDSRDVFEEIVFALKQIEGSKKLLIINNADRSIEPYIDRLPSQPDWHLVVLSTESINGLKKVNLSELDKQSISKLFKSLYKKDVEDELVSDFFEISGKHIPSFKILIDILQNDNSSIEVLKRIVEDKTHRDIFIFYRNLPQLQNVILENAGLLNLAILSKLESNIAFLFACMPYKEYCVDFIILFFKPLKYSNYDISKAIEKLIVLGLLKSPKIETYFMHQLIRQYVINTIACQEEVLEILKDRIDKKLEMILTSNSGISEGDILMDYPSFAERVIDIFESGGIDKYNIDTDEYYMLYFIMSDIYSHYGVHVKALNILNRIPKVYKERNEKIKSNLLFLFHVKRGHLYKQTFQLELAKKQISIAFEVLKNEPKLLSDELSAVALPLLTESMIYLNLQSKLTSFMLFIDEELKVQERARVLIDINAIRKGITINSLLISKSYTRALEFLEPLKNHPIGLKGLERIASAKIDFLIGFCLEELEKFKEAKEAYSKAGNHSPFGVYNEHYNLCRIGYVRCCIALEEFNHVSDVIHHTHFHYKASRYSVEAHKPTLDLLYGRLYHHKSQYIKALEYFENCEKELIKRFDKENLLVAEVLLYKSRTLEQLINWKADESMEAGFFKVSEFASKTYSTAADCIEILKKMDQENKSIKELMDRMDRILHAGYTITYKSSTKSRIKWQRKPNN